jgi:hypothetical protein
MEKVLGEGNTPISNLKDFPKLMIAFRFDQRGGFGKLNFVKYLFIYLGFQKKGAKKAKKGIQIFCASRLVWYVGWRAADRSLLDPSYSNFESTCCL